jgi:ATP-dependent Clp protease protease subunit
MKNFMVYPTSKKKIWTEETDLDFILPTSSNDQGNDIEENLRNRGIYYIVGEIDTGTLIPIQQDLLLKHLTPSWKDDVQLFINSCGGCAQEMWALVDLMEFVRMDVWTTVIGQASSAGAVLLAAGTKGKRRAAPNASIMIHQVAGGLGGNYSQIVAQSKDYQMEHMRHLKFWARHSNLGTIEEVEKQLVLTVDNSLSIETAMKFGVIDEILGYEKDSVSEVERAVESVVASIEAQEEKIVRPSKSRKPNRKGVEVLGQKRKRK